MPPAPPPTVKLATLPSVRSVIVTTALFEVAVTPAAAGHKVIAAARLVANVVVLLLVANVPLVGVGVEQAFEPGDPPVTLPHEKMPLRFDPPTARNGPGVGLVTVNVLPEV
jgi:hypothetical protein